jgi:hypothetical protein
METRITNLSKLPVQSGVSDSIENPIRAERFTGTHQTRLSKQLDITQFGINHI